MYGAGDVRVETVPDARIAAPTDALVTITHACICGSDLWPYRDMPASARGVRKRRANISSSVCARACFAVGSASRRQRPDLRVSFVAVTR